MCMALNDTLPPTRARITPNVSNWLATVCAGSVGIGMGRSMAACTDWLAKSCLVDQLASQGKGIVMVSSDLEELFETCDSIAVMSAGRLVQQYARGEWSADLITRASFSGYAKI